mmetsp:Transcript_9244/g.32579  ORF Transcript_9244/g.32579 Transcript_9244/m.32579 type:complete len:323 (-) Transcript_9244:273-1241(-)
MGQQLPVPDARMQKVIDLLELEDKHLKKLWAIFRKYDKDKSGTVDTKEFYDLVHEKPSVFADSIFELIEVENEGELDFSEFVQAISTYCMFGKEDVLKFCFYIFDRDKNGYIEEDELHALVQMLHQNSLSANLRLSIDKLDTNNDGKVDFKEFKGMNDSYPQVLFPAFRMQANMMMYTLGNTFWMNKRHQLETKRLDLIKKSQKIQAAEEKRLQAIQRREIRRRMGFVRYYVCCLERQKYAMAIQPGGNKMGKANKARLKKEKKTKKDELGDTGPKAGETRDESKRSKRKKKVEAEEKTVASAKRQASRKERSKERKARSRG